MARKVVDGDILGGNVSKRNSGRGAVGDGLRTAKTINMISCRKPYFLPGPSPMLNNALKEEISQE